MESLPRTGNQLKMTLATNHPQQKLTLAQFVRQLPDEEGRYELVAGEVVRILATRRHEDLADFLARQFDKEVERLDLNYRVSGRIVIRTLTSSGSEQGRNSDGACCRPHSKGISAFCLLRTHRTLTNGS